MKTWQDGAALDSASSRTTLAAALGRVRWTGRNGTLSIGAHSCLAITFVLITCTNQSFTVAVLGHLFHCCALLAAVD